MSTPASAATGRGDEAESMQCTIKLIRCPHTRRAQTQDALDDLDTGERTKKTESRIAIYGVPNESDHLKPPIVIEYIYLIVTRYYL